jgi:hypothetical protein
MAVKVEEEFQPFQFRFEGCRAVTEIYGGVQGAVGVEELLRHGVGIVEIGQGGIGKFDAGIQNFHNPCYSKPYDYFSYHNYRGNDIIDYGMKSGN